jgi:NAD(P)-dependent dehydrogenase (short-subunit alcohol dehydrogenase family)
MKNIIITGTSRGIGLQLALQMADAGHQVLALSRNSAEALLAHPNCNCLNVDLLVEADMVCVVDFIQKQWGRVDVLIHNAGLLVNNAFESLTSADFMAVYQVNVFGVARLTQACLPYLQAGSHVVAISSMGGIQGSSKFAGLAAYSSSKGAVITLMEVLAAEYQSRNISFNTLALGAVQTEMLEAAFPGYQAPTSAQDMAKYICNFALHSQAFFNGKTLQVSSSNP